MEKSFAGAGVPLGETEALVVLCGDAGVAAGVPVTGVGRLDGLGVDVAVGTVGMKAGRRKDAATNTSIWATKNTTIPATSVSMIRKERCSRANRFAIGAARRHAASTVTN
jgi:hypothetical protein